MKRVKELADVIKGVGESEISSVVWPTTDRKTVGSSSFFSG